MKTIKGLRRFPGADEEKEPKLMKRTRTFISLILTLALALSLSPIGALAANGPSQADYEGWYYAYATLLVLDENGYLLDDPESGTVSHPIYRDRQVTNDIAGAHYDLASNTLTLTDFYGVNLALELNAMGDDFTLCINGDCSLAWICVYGSGYGGSLTISGEGTLEINPNRFTTVYHGILMCPEDSKISLNFGEFVSVDVCAAQNAVAVFAGGGEEGDVTVTFGNGRRQEVNRIQSTEQYYLYAGGSVLSADAVIDKTIMLGTAADDPDGVFEVTRFHVKPEDGSPEYDEWSVVRYVYAEEYDLYLEDHVYGFAHGDPNWSDITFRTYEGMQQAGFDILTDAAGSQKSMQIQTLRNYSNFNPVIVNPRGDEYACVDVETDGEFIRIPAEIVLIPGLEDTDCLFLPRPDLPLEDFSQKVETVALDGVYDYYLGGVEFHYSGNEAGEDRKYIPGDMDGNGRVNSADGRILLRIAARLQIATSDQLQIGDLNGDTAVNSADARRALRIAARLDPTPEKRSFSSVHG